MSKEASGKDDPFVGIDLDQVAERLRALAHPDRLRLVAQMLTQERSVGDLCGALDMPQPTVSGHLRILQSRGMLVCRRDGQRMLYRVGTPALHDICTCIRTHFGSCR
jgi:ArsR family transcriptional regulator